jgi:transcriptional repressor NrdR
MVCIYCGRKTEIINSRSQKRLNQTWRRRHCEQCGNTFTTIERYDLAGSVAVKKGNDLSPFIAAKLLISIYKSMAHRQSAAEDADNIASTVIGKLISARTAQIDTNYVKKTVHETLLHFDKAAATSYRAYHDYDNWD